MGYNSGARARELGIGSSGTLPSNPDLDYMFHGKIDERMLKKVLGRTPTPEDVAAAQEIAARVENQNVDTFVKELLGVGAKWGRQQVPVDNTRMAGQALAGAGGLAGLLAAIDYADGPDKGHI